ncbi:hypothetical protein ACFPRL_19565 [Pseudoclavibacter helvolus]
MLPAPQEVTNGLAQGAENLHDGYAREYRRGDDGEEHAHDLASVVSSSRSHSRASLVERSP